MKLRIPLERKEVGAAGYAARLSLGARGRPYKESWDAERAVRDGTEKVVWAYRGVDALATAAAGLPLGIRDGHPKKGPWVEDHRLLPILNFRPNPFETAWDFRYRVSSLSVLDKAGVKIEIVRNAMGEPLQLYVLPPGRTFPVPPATLAQAKKTGPIAYWEVDMGAGEENRRLPDADVLWVKRPHPINPYTGQSPFEAAGLSIDSDVLARLYNRNFLLADGRPAAIVGVHGDMDDDVRDEIQARVDGPGGVVGAGRTVVLQTGEGGVEIAELGSTHRDAQYVEARKQNRDDVLISLGTPESALGNASGRTWANAEAELVVYWSVTMPGHVAPLDSALDALTEGDLQFVRHDFADVDVLRKLQAETWAAHLNEFKAGAITLNMFLKATGRDPVEDAAGDKFWLPMSIVAAISADAGTKGWDPIAQIEDYLKVVREDDHPVPFFETPKGGANPGNGERTPLPGEPGDPFLLERKAHAEFVIRLERMVLDRMVDHFDRQEKVVLTKLRGKARKGTRHWEYRGAAPTDLKAIDVAKVFDVPRWKKELGDEAQEWLETVFEESGSQTLRALTAPQKARAISTAFDLTDPNVVRAILQRKNRITGITDTTAAAVASAIADGELAGDSIDAIARRVSGVFDLATGYRARMIARTEVVSAANSASLIAARQSQTVEKKVWLSAIDHRTRDAHLAADGQAVELDELFSVGGESMGYPGDTRGSSWNTIQCRCTLMYERARADTPAGQPTEVEPSGTPNIADDETVDPSIYIRGVYKSARSVDELGPGAKVRKGIEEALDAIGRVHKAPTKMNRTRAIQGSGRQKLGHYRWDQMRGTPVEIMVSSAGTEHQSFTFAHEFGHFFDHQDFGDLGDYSSMTPGLDPATPIGRIMEAIRGSDTWEQLDHLVRTPEARRIALPDGRRASLDLNYLRYLRGGEESFARAYSQWIATETQNPNLLSGLNKMRTGGRTEQLHNVTQWADEDFEPIAAAFREAFRQMGLIK